MVTLPRHFSYSADNATLRNPGREPGPRHRHKISILFQFLRLTDDDRLLIIDGAPRLPLKQGKLGKIIKKTTPKPLSKPKKTSAHKFWSFDPIK